jgi:hypothetical protein
MSITCGTGYSRSARTRVRTGAAVPAALLVGAVIAAVPAAPAFAATWSVTPTPDAGSGRNMFAAVDAISTTDAWAVGYSGPDSAPWVDRPLAARWNGSTWSLDSPPTPTGGGWLSDVDGNATGNVWAVGQSGGGALTQRWNGTAWSTVPNPVPAGANGAVLEGVKTFDTGSAWAVGSATLPSSRPSVQTLIQRWNGTSWSIVPSPNPDQTQNKLVAVDGVAADDAWAVGGIGHDGYGGETVTPLVLRWNGSTWTRVPLPDDGPMFSVPVLRDVVVVSNDDVWAVGQVFHLGLLRQVPYLLHWNGQTWQHSTIPTPPAGVFNGVTALSSTKVYAVGVGDSRALIARWNGAAWSRETTPSTAGSSLLGGAAATGTGTVWGVGAQANSSGTLRTLAMYTSGG